jgi:putative transposase
VFSVKYHVIWCSTYRRRILVGRVKTRLEGIIGQVVDEVGGEVVEVIPDQVHLLVKVPSAVPLSRLVQELRRRSSGLWRRAVPRLPRRMPVLWPPAWLVSAMGGAPLEVVDGDLENQRRAA